MHLEGFAMSLFELDEQRRLLAATARKLATEKLRPKAIEREFEGKFPWDSVALFGNTGLWV